MTAGLVLEGAGGKEQNLTLHALLPNHPFPAAEGERISALQEKRIMTRRIDIIRVLNLMYLIFPCPSLLQTSTETDTHLRPNNYPNM
jgi:hypothetical protein